ncbi:MAG TPA: VOC family protein [Allosphingosinicella sp.]|jgi:hydroxymethylpyrimidine/phosphomethylpyrimidine kinase
MPSKSRALPKAVAGDSRDRKATLRLNQVTVPAEDYELSCSFYRDLGLKQIVAAPPRYARFEASNGATFSIHVDGSTASAGTVVYFETNDVDRLIELLERGGAEVLSPAQDQPWLWREARLKDPAGNIICLYTAGRNRRFPPWRLGDPAHPPAD